MSKKIAKMGIFVALAMIFTYVELLIPINIGVPGIKLGLANLVVVTGLYLFKPNEVLLISIVRILLMGILFGNAASLIYSLSGGILSFIIMLVLKKTNLFSIIAISISGGVFHNIGQIGVAVVVLHNVAILSYLPVLMITGIITGTLIGFISNRIIISVNQFTRNF